MSVRDMALAALTSVAWGLILGGLAVIVLPAGGAARLSRLRAAVTPRHETEIDAS